MVMVVMMLQNILTDFFSELHNLLYCRPTSGSLPPNA